MAGQILPVKAQALAFGGGIVCSPLSDAETRKIFVGGLIPGEEAQVTVTDQASNFLHGQLVSITAPDIARRKPPCTYFDQCGGCNLQYMNIEAQRAAKISMIETMLTRQGGLTNLPKVLDVSGGLPEFAYRLRATFHLSHDGRLGFYRLGSREVVPINECMIAEKAINDQLKKLHKVSRELAPFIACIQIHCEEKTTVICKLRDRITPFKVLHLKKIWGDLKHVQLQYKGKDLVYSKGQFLPAPEVSTGHFSQVNRYGNERLVKEVLARATGDEATELYAGSGNFTFPLARRGCEVAAVELDQNLVAAGERAAAHEKISKKIDFYAMSCERFVRRHTLRKLVILDPPRSGALEVIRKGGWRDVETVIYISCNLPSLARDMKLLVQDSGFMVAELLLVDMFPQTHHTEVVAVLRKEK